MFLPPLRERKDDVLALANHFSEKFSAKMRKPIRRITTSAINMLMAYHWPGNVRELENCIEHAVLLSRDGVIHGRDLPPTLQMPAALRPNSDGTLRSNVAQLERDMLVDALKRAGGNVSAAGRELGVGERIVRYKIRKFGIEMAHHRAQPPRRAAPCADPGSRHRDTEEAREGMVRLVPSEPSGWFSIPVLSCIPSTISTESTSTFADFVERCRAKELARYRHFEAGIRCCSSPGLKRLATDRKQRTKQEGHHETDRNLR